MTLHAIGQPIAVITGCDRGLGRATAVELAIKGWKVWATVLSAESIASIEAEHPNVTAIQMDVTSDEQVAHTAQAVGQASGQQGIAALVNNAGTVAAGPLEAVDMASFQKVMDVNFMGVVRVTRAFLPLLRIGQPGRVINIGSAAGTVAIPFWNAYACSKFALEAFHDMLRVEVEPQGIKVSLIKPGWIKTDLPANALDTSNAGIAKLSPEHAQLYGDGFKKNTVALAGGLTEAMEVGDAVAYICKALAEPSPRSRYMFKRDMLLLVRLRHWCSDWLWDKILNWKLNQYYKAGLKALKSEAAPGKSTAEPRKSR